MHSLRAFLFGAVGLADVGLGDGCGKSWYGVADASSLEPPQTANLITYFHAAGISPAPNATEAPPRYQPLAFVAFVARTTWPQASVAEPLAEAHEGEKRASLLRRVMNSQSVALLW